MHEYDEEASLMLEKLEDILNQSDKCHGDDPNVKLRLREQHNLICDLGTKYKFAVFKKVVMEVRNANLLNENEALQLKLEMETENSNKLENKVKQLEETVQSLEQIKSSYEELTNSLADGSLHVTHKTSFTDSTTPSTPTYEKPDTVDCCTQVWLPAECDRCKYGELHPTLDGLSITLTQADLARLDDNMIALKSSLKAREKSWKKMESQNRNQRSHICRLDSELVTQREIASTRKLEIDNKTIEIKELRQEFEKKQKEIQRLKKQATKERRIRSLGKSKEADSMSTNSIRLSRQEENRESDNEADEGDASVHQSPDCLTRKAPSGPKLRVRKATPTNAAKEPPTKGSSSRSPSKTTRLQMTLVKPKGVTKTQDPALIYPQNTGDNVDKERKVPPNRFRSLSRGTCANFELRATEEEDKPSLRRGPPQTERQRLTRGRSTITRPVQQQPSPHRSININLKQGCF